MLNNFSIKARLVAVLAILSAFMTVVGLAGIISLSNTNAALKTVYEDRLVALGDLQEVIRYINRNQIALAGADNEDPARLPDTVAAVEANLASASKAWARFASTNLTPEEKVLAERFAAARAIFLDEGLKPALAAARAGDVARINALLKGRMEDTFPPVRDSMNKLIQIQLDVGKSAFETSQEHYGSFRLLTIGLLCAGLGLAAGIGWWLVRSITVPLNRAVQLAQAVAAGDLTQDIDVRSNDETGKLLAALREMNTSLAGIVSGVRTATDSIATASSEIASGNMDLSARTEQQAGSLEETASSMEELTSTVRQNADNARQANQLASSASEVAQRGGAVVSQVVDKMGAINESAYKIVEIITVIDGIAFQTNILALNAAVEAARAGEQGRGFAVVASEVRNLAQRAAGAAKEIKQLIDNSVAQVEEGSRLADQAGSTMQEVVSSVQRVSDIIGEISTASDEQSAGIQQVNETVVQMDNMTQQNAALVEQAAAAAGALQDQAASLAQAVSVFRLAAAHGSGNGAMAAATTPPRRSAVVTHLQPRGKVAAKAVKPVRADRLAAVGDWEEF
jgi:methyl-accepting chemotaxis protein-1 (serine sensor receptor)